MSAERPCEVYRTAVRQLLRHYVPDPRAEPRDDFRAYLRRSRGELDAELGDASATPESRTATRNGLFVLAVGLFACGEHDAGTDILDNLPETGAMRDLVLVLPALLPMDEAPDPRLDPGAFRDFLERHAGRLRWHEERGVYEAS